MRLLSIVGLLASLLSPSLCERRNTAVCSFDPGFECADGEYCAFSPGEDTGTCKPAQCSTSKTSTNSCPVNAPLCDRGLCTRCASNVQCSRLSPTTPICDPSGSCVGCREDRECGDALAPICDVTTHSCRPCRAHADCVSGVCAKDDTFASLSAPIRAGSCVDASRINVVSSTCTDAMCFRNVLASAAANKPYILIKGALSLSGRVLFPQLPSDLPSYYIIGPTADTAPSALTSTSPLEMSNPIGTALAIADGAHTTLEGVVIVRSDTALDCGSGSATPTRVRLLRSFIGDNDTGIVAAAPCELTIDASWLGRGPPPQFSGILRGNQQALRFDGSRLDIVNSVFWNNGAIVMGTGVFGGIRITSSAPRVRIVNTSFVENATYETSRNVLAIDCTNAIGSSMSIINSLFLTSSFSFMPGTTYVHSNCRVNSTLYGTLSNEPALVDPNHSQNLADGTLDDSLFVKQSDGNLRIADSASARVRKSGVTQASDAQGAITIPKLDMDGKSRGDTSRSSGAFEAAP